MPSILHSRTKQFIALAHDSAMSVLAVLIATAVRFNGVERVFERNLLVGAVLPFAVAAVISLLVLQTFRTSWRHVSMTDLIRIVATSTLAVLIYLPLSFLFTRLEDIPRSYILMPWMLLILLMSGSRVAYRLYMEGTFFDPRRRLRPGQMPILIVGDAASAEIFLRSLDRSAQYFAVGLLNELAHGTLLRGVPTLGRVNDIERILAGFGDDETRPRKLVVADRAMAPEALDRLVDVALRHGLSVGRIPDPTLLRPGTEAAPDLQPISVEDLLGRSQIVLDPLPVQQLIAGRRVLITGAGGSIGSEIVRQVCAIGPSALCLIDSSEFNLYTIDAEVAERWPGLARASRIVDVRHRTLLRACFEEFRPDIVFHAAALKHVPLVEENPLAGIWTNTIGSRNVADAASAVRARAMVLISTDKAVNPTNVMGASKRSAEAYCQALALKQAATPEATRFVVVRFGNVLGSTGSVVPLFERQLKAGGPLTVTHPDVQRYFMTIREAVQLVLQASALGASTGGMQGKVFVLDMGRPVRIVDLARQMIARRGVEIGRDLRVTRKSGRITAHHENHVRRADLDTTQRVAEHVHRGRTAIGVLHQPAQRQTHAPSEVHRCVRRKGE